ncbi:MAG: hypothetical protein U1E76_24305 [Planctomycetota bacterium]
MRLQSMAGVVSFCLLSVCSAAAGVTERVSLGTGRVQANDNSFAAALSWGGRYVAFSSVATNLVPGDTNHKEDVFVHDRVTGTTVRVSVASDGTQANDWSTFVPGCLSWDGTKVAFISAATNLVPGDTNDTFDVFVHDLQSGQTVRADVSSSGEQANQGSFWFTYLALSGDGRTVAFASWSDNLVPGDTNAECDVFVHDLQSGVTSRASVSSSGAEANFGSFGMALSGDGRFVAFDSGASNLVAGDANGMGDVFRHDRVTGETILVSLSSQGKQGDGDSYQPWLSADGSVVAFSSTAPDLSADDGNGTPDVFVRELATGTTRLASLAPNGGRFANASTLPCLSADGSLVVFVNPERTFWCPQAFAHDLRARFTSPVSVGANGDRARDYFDDPAFGVAVSGDGIWRAFGSYDDQLVDGDTNLRRDVFIRRETLLAFDGVPQNPNPVHFTVSHGERTDLALVLLSGSGTDGFLLHPRYIPLTFDALTLAGLQAFTLLSAFVDDSGTAVTPTVTFPVVESGVTFFATAITLDRSSGAIESVSAPITVVTQ